ncbi:hypothetical protein HQ560_00505 [bacterium]|nr:hypothetical protein [bacterium]
MIRANLAALLTLVLLPFASSLAAAQMRLCIEYLPVIVYEDEAVTVSARVEGAGAFTLTASLADSRGNTLEAQTAKGTAAAEAPWRGSLSVSPGAGTPAALLLRLKGEGGTSTLRAPILSGRSALPPLQVKGARLCDAGGSPVLVRIEHRVFQRQEHWPFIRWVGIQMYGDGWEFDRVAIVAGDLGAPGGGVLAALAASKSPKITVVPVPAMAPDVGLPVLRAVAALTSAQDVGKPDLALLFLGHADVDFGTDVIGFGRALELILQQFEVRGCRQFAIAPPVGPPHMQKRLDPYARAARRVARIYHARVLPVGAALNDAHWAAGGPTAPVALRWPNADGHQALAQAILNALASIRQ